MRVEQTKITLAYWFISFVLLVLLLSSSAATVFYQWRLMLAQQQVSYENQVDVAVSVISRDLTENRDQRIREVMEDWARHIQGLLSIVISDQHEKVIASHINNRYTAHSIVVERPLPGFKGHRFKASFDLSPLHDELWSFLRMILFANLLIVALIMFLMWLIIQRYVITPMRLSENRLIDLATIDPLTDVYNRRSFTDMSETQIERCKRQKHPLCMAMMDLDHFKLVNDYYGHAIGDLVLILFANEAKLYTRSYDILGRYGGEEFALCLPGLDLQQGIETAERIVEKTANLPHLEGSKKLPITVSIGIVEMQADDDFATLIKKSDDALYLAKQAGRNCVYSIDNNS